MSTAKNGDKTETPSPPKETSATENDKQKNDVFIIDEKEKDLLAGDEDVKSKFEDPSNEDQPRSKPPDTTTLMTLPDTMSSTSSMSGPDLVLVEEKESKETFANKLEYILTLVSYAIGFGTMWRFPYLMQQYGGVVFLIPYSFMLGILGIPIFLLEVAVGQRIRKSSIKSWNQISHYLAGIGIAAAVSCVLIGFYENTLIAWCFSYLISSVQDPLPWSSCKVAESGCNEKDADESKCSSCELAGTSQYYWYKDILEISEGITIPGTINWKMFGCLVFSWIVIWAILVKGMAVAGKIAYITSLLPYLVMAIFFVRGLFVEGMKYGFEVVFTPDWTVLYDIKVWFIAGTQILFTQGVANGILVSYAALQPPNNNCIKDAIMVPLIDFFTSVLACLVNCPILGSKGLTTFNICKRKAFDALNAIVAAGTNETGIIWNVTSTRTTVTNEPDLTWNLTSNATTVTNITYFGGNGTISNESVICDVYELVKMSASGTGLVFITFTTAVTQFPLPQLWAVLFFVMLLTVGIGSSFPQIEGFVLCLQDVDLFHIGKVPKWKITTAVCFILMCFSIFFAFGWGQYVLSFLDEFGANWSLLVISFSECVGIAWVYGLRKFAYDLHIMTGKPPTNYFIQFILITLKFIAPFVMIILIFFQLYQYAADSEELNYLAWNETLSHAVKIPWPIHVAVVGFLITAIAVGLVVVFPILAYFKIYPLREEKKSKFPERRLRRDRSIPEREYQEDEYRMSATRWEKILYWKFSDWKRKPPPLLEEIPTAVKDVM